MPIVPSNSPAPPVVPPRTDSPPNEITPPAVPSSSFSPPSSSSSSSSSSATLNPVNRPALQQRRTLPPVPQDGTASTPTSTTADELARRIEANKSNNQAFLPTQLEIQASNTNGGTSHNNNSAGRASAPSDPPSETPVQVETKSRKERIQALMRKESMQKAINSSVTESLNNEDGQEQQSGQGVPEEDPMADHIYHEDAVIEEELYGENALHSMPSRQALKDSAVKSITARQSTRQAQEDGSGVRLVSQSLDNMVHNNVLDAEIGGGAGGEAGLDGDRRGLHPPLIPPRRSIQPGLLAPELVVRQYDLIAEQQHRHLKQRMEKDNYMRYKQAVPATILKESVLYVESKQTGEFIRVDRANFVEANMEEDAPQAEGVGDKDMRHLRQSVDDIQKGLSFLYTMLSQIWTGLTFTFLIALGARTSDAQFASNIAKYNYFVRMLNFILGAYCTVYSIWSCAIGFSGVTRYVSDYIWNDVINYTVAFLHTSAFVALLAKAHGDAILEYSGVYDTYYPSSTTTTSMTLQAEFVANYFTGWVISSGIITAMLGLASIVIGFKYAYNLNVYPDVHKKRLLQAKLRLNRESNDDLMGGEGAGARKFNQVRDEPVVSQQVKQEYAKRFSVRFG